MKTYLIDLDGTMYSGNTNIDGAREFIAYLQEKGFPYIFLTNNATRTKTQAKEHMLNLGFKNIKEDDFFTSAIATAKYIAKNYSERKCFMIGESGLEEALKEENFIFVEDKADFVVVGLDRKANYTKYSEALHHILAGAKFIATINILLEDKNLKKEDIILLGDNLETDIKLGYEGNIETIMVCSGVHDENDIERLKVYPTKVVKNLKELIK